MVCGHGHILKASNLSQRYIYLWQSKCGLVVYSTRSQYIRNNRSLGQPELQTAGPLADVHGGKARKRGTLMRRRQENIQTVPRKRIFRGPSGF